MADMLFRDRDGVQWSATRQRAGNMMQVQFVNEAGERRVATVLPIDETAWAGLSEHAWQALLERADPE